MAHKEFFYKIKSNLQDIHSLQEQLMDLEKVHTIPKDIISKINLSIEEMVINIIQYNNKTESESISVKITLEDEKISYCLIDEGQSFNPMEFTPYYRSTHLQKEGLGSMLSKTTMDEMSYSRKEGKNYLTLSKKLS